MLPQNVCSAKWYIFASCSATYALIDCSVVANYWKGGDRKMVDSQKHKINLTMVAWMGFSLSFILVGLAALFMFLLG